LLKSEVLDLVLYVELQKATREESRSDVPCFFSSAGMEKVGAAGLIFHMIGKDLLLFFVST